MVGPVHGSKKGVESWHEELGRPDVVDAQRQKYWKTEEELKKMKKPMYAFHAKTIFSTKTGLLMNTDANTMSVITS